MKSICCLVGLIGLVATAAIGGQDVHANMVQIPAGEFWMGRTHMWLIDELSMHLRARLDDQPAHLVYLDSFWMDKYEVTNQDYARFTDATGHRRPYHWIDNKIPTGTEKNPVYNVSWDDAVDYCRSLGKRLPTEAEWERAARGGVDQTLYPWGEQLRPGAAGRGGGGGRGADPAAAPPAKLAHYGFPNGPTAVGSYPPNKFGLYDVTGNLWEWTNDWYGHSYYSVSPDKNPKGPETGLYRVIRGGGWSDNDERLLTLHYRNFTNPDHRTPTVGLRCAM